MSKQIVINPLDALDNALGNYAEGSISAEALARVANEANAYIMENGLDGKVLSEETVRKILEECERYVEITTQGRETPSFRSIASKYGIEL